MDDYHEAVSRRAYALWEQAGKPHGQQDQHWQQALSDLGQVPTVLPAGPSSGTQGLEDLPANAASMQLASVRQDQ